MGYFKKFNAKLKRKYFITEIQNNWNQNKSEYFL